MKRTRTSTTENHYVYILRQLLIANISYVRGIREICQAFTLLRRLLYGHISRRTMTQNFEERAVRTSVLSAARTNERDADMIMRIPTPMRKVRFLLNLECYIESKNMRLQYQDL